MRNHPRAALFLDMGLGKTVTTLTAMGDLYQLGDIHKPGLIIAPNRVINTVWPQEAQNWSHTLDLTFARANGSNEKARIAGLQQDAMFYLVNPENVTWLMLMMDKHPKLANRFGTIIIDESSMFKDPRVQRFKNLVRHLDTFTQRYILTGTPRSKSLANLWSQIFVLDEGHRLGDSYDRFFSRFFEKVDYMGYDYQPRTGASEYVYELLKDIALRLDAADWLDLPPVIDNVVKVQLPARARELYKTMERDMIIQLQTGRSISTITAVNAAVLTGKCHQLANGTIYTNKERTEWEDIHNEKFEALQEITDNAGGPVIVCYQFRHELARLKKQYPLAPVFSESKDDERLVFEWDLGLHPVMFMHPASGGHGLNLQKGGNHMVFFSLTWSDERYDQVFERIGPTRQVNLADHVIRHHIVAENTIDEVMLDGLTHNANEQRDWLNLLRQRYLH